jgi:hypothetical protein
MIDETYLVSREQLEFFINISREFVFQSGTNLIEIIKTIEDNPATLFDFTIRKARESGNDKLKIDFLKALAFRGYQSLLGEIVKLTAGKGVII